MSSLAIRGVVSVENGEFPGAGVPVINGRKRSDRLAVRMRASELRRVQVSSCLSGHIAVELATLSPNRVPTPDRWIQAQRTTSRICRIA